MVTRDQARELAANYLSRRSHRERSLHAQLVARGIAITPAAYDVGFELVLLNEHESETRSSFVFNYAARGLIETGNTSKYQLFGGGPLLVDKLSGEIHSIGSGCWSRMGIEGCLDRFDLEHHWLTQFFNGVNLLNGNQLGLAEEIFQSLLETVQSAPSESGIPPLLQCEPGISLIPAIQKQLARIHILRGAPPKAIPLLSRALEAIERKYVIHWHDQLTAILSDIVTALRACGQDAASEEFKLACCLYQTGMVRQSEQLLESLYSRNQQGGFDVDAESLALVARICNAMAQIKLTFRDVQKAGVLFEESLVDWYRLLGENPSRTLSISRGGALDLAKAEKNFELTSKYGSEFGAMLASYAAFLKEVGDDRKSSELLGKSAAVRSPTYLAGPAWLQRPYCVTASTYQRSLFALVRLPIELAARNLSNYLERIEPIRYSGVHRDELLGASKPVLLAQPQPAYFESNFGTFLFPVCDEGGLIVLLRCEFHLISQSEEETACNWKYQAMPTGWSVSGVRTLPSEAQMVSQVEAAVLAVTKLA